MSKERVNPVAEEPKFKWEVSRSSEYGVAIYLKKENGFKSIGEFSFSMRQMKKLDPEEFDYGLIVMPYPCPAEEYLKSLKSESEEWAKKAAIALETKPSTVAYVSMWQINDEARGNLSVIRQMFKVALPEFRKYKVEYFVGHYVAQRGEGLTVAPYAEDMYKRLAAVTGGEVHADGNVWVSVEGLAKWLKM